MVNFKKGIACITIFTLILSSIPFHNFAQAEGNQEETLINQESIMTEVDEGPTEIVEERTIYSKTFDNHDGTVTTEISQSPLHFESDSGLLKELDNTLVETPDGKVKNVQNEFTVEFDSLKTPETTGLSLKENDVELQMNLEEAIINEQKVEANITEGEVKENSVSYPNIFSDISLDYTVGDDFIKEDIIIHERPVSGLPEKFSYSLSLEGLSHYVEDNRIYLFDKNTEDIVYEISAPYMYDSFVQDGFSHGQEMIAVPEEAKSFDISLAVREEDGKLYVDLIPDKEWMEDEKRIYPIVIDPTISRIQDSSVTMDSMMRSTYTGWAGGGETEIGAGRASENIVRSLLRFDLSSIPVASQILSADLNLYLSSTNSATPIDMSVHKLSSVWEESDATWVDKTDSEIWSTPGADYVSTPLARVNGISTVASLMQDRLVRWAIPLTTVSGWTSMPETNHGFLIKSVDETQKIYKKFYSSESTVESAYKPKLVITYKTNARLGLESHWDYAAHPLAEGSNSINIGTLNNIIQFTDLSLTNYADFGFDFTRTYNSKEHEKSAFGYGWTFTGDEKLYINTNQTQINYQDEDGTVHVFEWNGTKHISPKGFDGNLLKKDSLTYELKTRDGFVSTFSVREQTLDTDVKVAYLTKRQDIHLNEIQYLYNTSNQLYMVRTGLGHEMSFTYLDGVIVKTVSKGKEITYSYNDKNYLVSAVVKKSDTEVTTTTYQYTDNILTGVVDPTGSLTAYSYLNGYLYSVTEPQLAGEDPSTTTYVLDRGSMTTTVTDPEGKVTVYGLDSNYVVKRITIPGVQETQYTLDADYRILSEQMTVYGEESYIKNYEYNAVGDMLRWSDSKGENHTYTYDTVGNLLTETDTAGNKTTNVYNTKNNLISTTTPKGERTDFTYDQKGQMTQMKSPAGNIQTFSTDYLNERKSTVYTDASTGVSTVSVQDFEGNLLSSTDGKGQMTSYVYNLKNELTQVTDAAGNVTTYAYDGNGNRTLATNAAGQTMQLEYNSQNGVSRETNALGHSTTYSYRADGELSKLVKANGMTIEYGTDEETQTNTVAVNQQVQFTTQTQGLTNTVTNHTLSGQVTSYSQSEDGLMESIEFSSPLPTRISYTYGENNYLTSLKFRDREINYTRDSNGLVVKMTQGTAPLVEYTYNTQSMPVNQKFGNSSTILNTYKADQSTLISQELRSDETTRYNRYAYTYDSNQQITNIMDDQGNVAYTYDAINQLVEEQYSDGLKISYTYDSVGNRISKKMTRDNVTQETNYRYNVANQMTEINSQAVDVDINGNIISDGTRQYVWNAFDQLVEVKSNTGVKLAIYKYDEMGRRIYKDDTVSKTYYRYDGTSNRVLFEEDASGNIINSYTYDENGYLLSWTHGGNTYFYLTNYRGDVLAVTDGQGNVVAEYRYDAWGNILSQKGAMASANPYRYAGYRYDEETSVYYLMARYYDSDKGIFLSLDPVRGDTMNPITMNGYSYANNNPVMNVDPNGEFSIRASLISSAIDFIISLIPIASGISLYLKALSSVKKPYRTWKGDKIIPTIKVESVKYLTRLGVKTHIAIQVVSFAILVFNTLTGFTIGKAVVAGLKLFFKTERRSVRKYGYWGPYITIDYINFGKRK